MKLELDRRLKIYKSITPMALGDVKYEVLAYLDNRRDIEI